MSLMHHRWLAEQLPAWEREGIVTAEGARTLRQRYAAEPRGGLAQMVVGASGALLIGTGLIAVLAYNWLQRRNKTIAEQLGGFSNDVLGYLASDGRVRPVVKGAKAAPKAPPVATTAKA